MEISVVIPLYNKEKYVYRAIASVLGQTTSPAEILLIDDGSTDHSVREVSRFNDHRIRLIQQANAGEGAARNRGVAESRTDFVAFLDADDEWQPDFLSHIQRLYRNFPDCGAYATAFEIIEANGCKSSPSFPEIPPAPWIGIIPNFFQVMQHGNILTSSSVALPKKVFWDLNGFPEGIAQGADRMMWIPLGMKYPIAYSPSRQAVVHGDAMNRASTVFQHEPAAANLIDRMLDCQEVPPTLVQDVKDYSVYLKIQKAGHRVKAGQAKSARELLASIRHNHKYRREFAWWYLLSLIPYPLLQFIRGLRSATDQRD